MPENQGIENLANQYTPEQLRAALELAKNNPDALNLKTPEQVQSQQEKTEKPKISEVLEAAKNPNLQGNVNLDLATPQNLEGNFSLESDASILQAVADGQLLEGNNPKANLEAFMDSLMDRDSSKKIQ